MKSFSIPTQTRRNIAAYSFLALVLLALLTANPFGPHRLTAQGFQHKSVQLLTAIAYGVYTYRIEHAGQLPAHLSQLVPNDLPSPSLFYLDAPEYNLIVPRNADSDAQLIDVFSIYALAPARDGGFVVYEKPSPWKDHTIAYVYVPMPSVTSGELRRSGRVNQSEFERLYFSNFKD